MGHIGRKDCYFNQIAMGKFINQNMITKLGLEHLKSFATRGVLVDAVKVFQQAGKLKTNPACKKPCLDKGTVITAADLQAGLRMYNVTLREGDIVIIHTGWGDLFEQYPAQNATFNSGEPGIGKDAAKWLSSQKVVAVGADQWADRDNLLGTEPLRRVLADAGLGSQKVVAVGADQWAVEVIPGEDPKEAFIVHNLHRPLIGADRDNLLG